MTFTLELRKQKCKERKILLKIALLVPDDDTKKLDGTSLNRDQRPINLNFNYRNKISASAGYT